MADFWRNHQLNIMLSLGSICMIIVVFVSITRAISQKRKLILIFTELSAALLLFADRFAYIYRGNTSSLGYYMVRISNYLVFSATMLVILGVNFYLEDLFRNEGGITTSIRRLKVISISIAVGQVLLLISQFTGMYYTFDETNHYQRAALFPVCYFIPLFVSLLMLSVIVQYYFKLNWGVRESLFLFTITPLLASIFQIYLYGLSLTNIAMVGMVVVLYIFSLLDMNATLERAHEIEMANMQIEKEKMKKLFDQTAMAFVTAVERKDAYTQGNSVRVAGYAKKVAELSGMDPEKCEEAYYAGLLYNVGLLGIPDSILQKNERLSEEEIKIMHTNPIIGNEILANITEYPFLSTASLYSHEHYDGSGYPKGLKGEEIPEIARIVGVADAYVAMTSKKIFREARPDFIAREELVKGGGEEFDPQYAQYMIQIIDDEMASRSQEEANVVESELSCSAYRDQVSCGIPIEQNIVRVTFSCAHQSGHADNTFFGPAMILFDSYDKRVHSNAKAIETYGYLEYGEMWFNEHSVSTAARKIKETILSTESDLDYYEIIMGRLEEFLKIRMRGPNIDKEVIAALPDRSKSAYAALTGENCILKNIKVENTGEEVKEGDITRIVKEISYTDRMESDIKNIQIDRTRSASTEGIALKDYIDLEFHAMSLPSATLVWHCAYVVIFYSDDGKVNGENYKEYGLIKLYGENEGGTAFAQNSITVKRTDEFPGWESWKEKHKEGLECEVNIRKKANSVILRSSVLGIDVENITSILENAKKVYVALTGDQVAITDIRVK